MMVDSPPASVHTQLAKSSAHSCLELRDITTIVVDFIHANDSDDTLVKYNLAAFARTCCATVFPALRMLWREQTGLDNLIRTLPADAWKEDIEKECKTHRDDSDTEGDLIQERVVFSLTRLLGSSEWERFDYYASFIRVLLIHDNERWSEWSPSVFTSLHLHQSFLRGGLLPNLKEFKYIRKSESSSSRYTFHQTPILLPYSLQVVELQVADKDKEWVQSLISYFPHAFLEIEHVRLSYFSSRGWRPIDIQPLTNCTNLKSFICDLYISNLETAVQLARLPKLEALSLTFAGQDPLDGVPPPVLTGPYEFPCLRSLTCNSSPKFLRACRFPVLQSFSTRHLVDIKDTLDALAEHCTPHLMREVEITGYGISDFSVENIWGLLKFHALKRVVIDVFDCGLNDEILELMASSWPNLKELDIKDDKANRPSPKNGLTLLALVPLVRHCPDLTSLSIKFKQQTSISLSDLPEANECSNLRLEEIHFYDSEVEYSQCDAIAEILSRLFPNLRKIKVWSYCWSQAASRRFRKRVVKMLEASAKARA